MAYDNASPAAGNAGLTDIAQIPENFNQLRKFELGAAEPSNLVAGMIWVDSSASTYVVKQRNKDNDAWLTLWELTTAGVHKTHLDDNITNANAVHGIQQGTGNSLDADTVDGYHYSDIYAFNGYNYIDNSGTTPLVTCDTERQTDSILTPSKLKEFTLNTTPSTSLKIYFELKAGTSGSAGAQIYRNGSPPPEGSTLRTTSSNTYVSYTETIAGWSNGDLLQLYAYKGPTGGNAYVQNFRILCSRRIDISVDQDDT